MNVPSIHEVIREDPFVETQPGYLPVSTKPWIAGTRAAGYWAFSQPVRVEAPRPEFEDLLERLWQTCDREAREVSGGQANAVVGVEMNIEVDPFGIPEGSLRLTLTGTAALLHSLA